MELADHWNKAYRRRSSDKVSWAQPRARHSVEPIMRLGLPTHSRVLDVGGGASALAGELLERGFSQVAVLDLSEEALGMARARLGARSSEIDWLVDDVLTADLPAGELDLWHDRAAFHFLTTPSARAAYVSQARDAIKEGGYLVIITFGPMGPERCSGLPTLRYSVEELAQEFAEGFEFTSSEVVEHLTPTGAIQQMTIATFRRV